MSHKLEINCWLVVSQGRRSYEATGRLAHKTPKLAPGEIPIKMQITLPASLFKQPQFLAKIEIPEPSPITPDVKIDDTLKALAESVQQNIGIKISFEPVEN